MHSIKSCDMQFEKCTLNLHRKLYIMKSEIVESINVIINQLDGDRE